MAQQKPPSGATPEASQGDAWHAFGALVSGVVVYGLIGWALDRWLGTNFLVVMGILLGVVLGLYMTWARFRPPTETSPSETQK
jgi:ATP synthase protein I